MVAQVDDTDYLDTVIFRLGPGGTRKVDGMMERPNPNTVRVIPVADDQGGAIMMERLARKQDAVNPNLVSYLFHRFPFAFYLSKILSTVKSRNYDFTKIGGHKSSEKMTPHEKYFSGKVTAS
jgi:hypothetical protein